jgi:hypothetical protein
MDDELGQNILRPHRKLEKNSGGQQLYAFNFKNSEFDDIIFSYDRVEFIEDTANDKLITKFNYIVHEHKREYDKIKFEKELGDFLIELVVQGALENNLIFTGGVDEQDRANDNSSSNN